MTSPLRGLNVLIADDQPEILQAVADLLRRKGHAVHCTTNGEEALRVATRHPLDAAVLDIDMPIKTGLQVARAIRNAPGTAHVRLIAMTGSVAPDLHDRCIEAGFDIICRKPFPASILLDALQAGTRPTSRGNN